MRRAFVSLCLIPAISPVALAESQASAPLELQAVNIDAASDLERADGPVIGYKATRSASATRTDTALHETPQSISVVPKDVLQDTAATRLQDGLDYAGGVGRANNFGG
jgi:iron complex outermembrane receptor protein